MSPGLQQFQNLVSLNWELPRASVCMSLDGAAIGQERGRLSVGGWGG